MSALVVPRACEMIGGPWDGDRTTARPWPIEVVTDRGVVTGRYVLRDAIGMSPTGLLRRVQEWHWEPA